MAEISPPPTAPIAAPPSPVPKRNVIDSIVLAFAHSEARELAGTDALRMVLDARYLELVKTPGTVDLQPVWDLLTTQPGFVPEQAVPPLCRVKAWEPQLKVQIALPRELATLSSIEIQVHAQKCKVSEPELARVLTTSQVGVPVADAARPGTRPPVSEPQAQPPTVRRRRMGLAIGFLVVAALAVAASVVFAMRYALSGPIILSASQVSNEIPLGETKQAGDAIGTLLTDMGWLGRPEPERRRQLEEALGRARKLGASTLLLLDRDGNVKAVARWGPGGAQVSFP